MRLPRNFIQSVLQDDNTGYAVGYVGTAIRTTDGGTTWTNLPLGSGEDLIQYISQLLVQVL